MRLHARLNIASLIVAILLLASFAVVAQVTQAVETIKASPLDWLYKNWPIVALILSEALAFVPTKAAGIAHAVFNVLTEIFKKKDPSLSTSQ
jgi:hypothetical protein